MACNLKIFLVLLLGTSSFANGGINFLTISDFHLNYTARYIMEIDPSGFSNDDAQGNDLDSGTFYKITDAIKRYTGDGNLGKKQVACDINNNASFPTHQ